MSIVQRSAEALEQSDLAGMSAKALAKTLGLSEQQLRRQLTLAGMNYSTLIFRERKRRVIAFMAEHPAASIEQLSLLCGYNGTKQTKVNFGIWFGVSHHQHLARQKPRGETA